MGPPGNCLTEKVYSPHFPTESFHLACILKAWALACPRVLCILHTHIQLLNFSKPLLADVNSEFDGKQAQPDQLLALVPLSPGNNAHHCPESPKVFGPAQFP